MSLKEYRKTRDFRQTPEPHGRQRRAKRTGLLYVIQKHDASHLHYDLRLELGGTLKSWAVPKGPTVKPGERRLAVHVEDHPLEYGTFEGTIPKGQYGGGTVMLWDRGTWVPDDDAVADYRRGRLSFNLHGEKLRGHWTLVQMHGDRNPDGKNWLLIKSHDDFASDKPENNPLEHATGSLATGRSLEAIATDRGDTSTPRNVTRGRKAGGDDAIATERVAQLPGARKGAIPTTLRPQLATPARNAPPDEHWLYEVKFDGYRLMAVRRRDTWRLLTRRGNDWTTRFPAVAEALAGVPLDTGVLDGEVVVLKDNGVSDFQALQNALRRDQTARLYYYVFDLPYCNGYDLTDVAQLDRKRVLRGILDHAGRSAARVRFSEHLRGRGAELLAQARRIPLEGLIAKRADAGYVAARSKAWLKLRCGNRQEFVVIGYTDPKGTRIGLGALLVGIYAGKTLRYAGQVGTGFDEAALKDLRRRLEPKALNASPAIGVPRADARGAHWVKPELVAEVAFTEWTSDGRLRHPVYRGLREEKLPAEVRRESAADASADEETPERKHPGAAGRRARPLRPERAASQSQVEVAGVLLTHPDKVLYPDLRLTKHDLAEYYVHVADWILPQVVDRPLSIVRCPAGQGRKCFFQKHVTESLGPAIHGVTIREKQGQARYLYIKDLAGLVALVQLGVLELHPWGSRTDRYERPDRMVFDLDPDTGLDFAAASAGAARIRELLEHYELRSFVKTTGGKGLHVVVPLARRNTWDEVRVFSEGVARALARAEPNQYTANMRKNKREHRVFVDYLRNAQGATAVAAFSTRARPGAPVAMPLSWYDLAGRLDAAGFNVTTVPSRMASRKSDPWKGLDAVRQSISKTMLRDVRRFI